jgi:hypothetical protein
LQLQKKLRNQPVIHAKNTYVVQCSEMRTYMDNHTIQLLKEKSLFVIEHAVYLKNNQYGVLRCGSVGEIYNVVREGKSTILDLENKTCSWCITRNHVDMFYQFDILLSRLQIPIHSIWDVVHPSCKIKQIQKEFGQQTIVIPTTYQMIPSVLAMEKKPAPRYNIKNQAESLHVKGPGRSIYFKWRVYK